MVCAVGDLVFYFLVWTRNEAVVVPSTARGVGSKVKSQILTFPNGIKIGSFNEQRLDVVRGTNRAGSEVGSCRRENKVEAASQRPC